MTGHKRLLIALVAVAVTAACQHPSTPSSGPEPSTRPTTTAGRVGAGGGLASVPRARTRLSLDSLGKLRRMMVNQVLATIAGHENEPASTVFKNVRYSKEMPAIQFVDMMDSSYGRALGWQCANCHVTTDFSSDAKKDKGRAKSMIEMTNVINKEHMPKLNAQKPEVVTCMLCHRGTNDPRDTIETYRAARPPGGN